MTKRISALILLLLLLCGCSSGSSPKAYDLSIADHLLTSGAFEGSEMAQVDLDIVAILYGIDPATITEGVCYMAVNTSASADELLVLVCTDEQAAMAARLACQLRLESQIAVCEDYCPAAVPRLEGARLDRIGNSVLFAVGDQTLINSVVGAR